MAKRVYTVTAFYPGGRVAKYHNVTNPAGLANFFSKNNAIKAFFYDLGNYAGYWRPNTGLVLN